MQWGSILMAGSNPIMNPAWYGDLKRPGKAVWLAVLGIWALAPVSALAGTVVIPPAYRGEFSMQAKWCGTEDNEEERIWVTATSVGYSEAFRDVAAVTTTRRGLRLRFKPWPRKDYVGGFDPSEGLQPPQELVLSQGGEVLNRHYRRCHVKRK